MNVYDVDCCVDECKGSEQKCVKGLNRDFLLGLKIFFIVIDFMLSDYFFCDVVGCFLNVKGYEIGIIVFVVCSSGVQFCVGIVIFQVIVLGVKVEIC